MDAFFAAIEERDNPQWMGKPIVVGADPMGGKGRGVVSTANYKARIYGISSALPIMHAWRASENARKRGEEPAIFLPPDMRKYSTVSQRVMAIMRRHAQTIEQASVDEAYLDLSFTGSYEEAAEVCRQIKKEIRDTERLTASMGVGPNKLIAKIASDQQKPDGLTIVTEAETERFLEPMSIRKIPGIGPKTEVRFARLGVKTVRDLKRFSLEELEEMLGKWGDDLYAKVRGIDNSPIEELYEAKSIGEQDTFLHDTLDVSFIFDRLKTLCQSVFSSFQHSGSESFRTVVVIVRFADFETKTRSHTVAEPIDKLSRFEFEAMKLLMPFVDGRSNPKRKLIRLIGVRVEKLTDV